jgi:hypothetical protein
MAEIASQTNKQSQTQNDEPLAKLPVAAKSTDEVLVMYGSSTPKLLEYGAKHIQDRFDKIDQNNDTVISKDELRKEIGRISLDDKRKALEGAVVPPLRAMHEMFDKVAGLDSKPQLSKDDLNKLKSGTDVIDEIRVLKNVSDQVAKRKANEPLVSAVEPVVDKTWTEIDKSVKGFMAALQKEQKIK